MMSHIIFFAHTRAGRSIARADGEPVRNFVDAFVSDFEYVKCLATCPQAPCVYHMKDFDKSVFEISSVGEMCAPVTLNAEGRIRYRWPNFGAPADGVEPR